VIAMLAVDTGIPPQGLWEADPADLATIVAVLDERARAMRRVRR